MELIELLVNALPVDMSIAELKTLGKAEWWTSRPTLAIAYALRKSPRINWQAYVENNADVKEKNIDPVLHFVQHGLFEGRKLRSWHPLRKTARKQAPKVSVIVPSYNNGIFLKKCLDSLAHQTLTDIEIIVVDDGSSDDSVAISREYINDPRFRLLESPQNQGLHTTRLIGAQAATGDYVMFLDADDFYAPDACELAWKAIIKGYDIGAFNCNLINLAHLSEDDVRAAELYFNRCEAGCYDCDQMKFTFIEERIGHNLNFKIFLRELIQEGFATLPYGMVSSAEDKFEYISIAKIARNIIKIDQKIYNYSRSYGVSLNSSYRLNSLFGNKEQNVYQYVYGILQNNTDKIYRNLFSKLEKDEKFSILPILDKNQRKEFLRRILEFYTPLEVLLNLLEKYRENYKLISLLARDSFIEQKHKDIHTIGIFYYRLSAGGIETTLSILCRILKENGYNPVILITERSANDDLMNREYPIHYLTRPDMNMQGDKDFLLDLYQTVQEEDIDVVFLMTLFHPITLWVSLFAKLLGLPLIGYQPSNFSIEMLNRGRSFTHSAWLNTLKSFSKIICLSKSCEIYLRVQDIDAVYIPNPIRKFGPSIYNFPKTNTIVVIARLDDALKKTSHALFILQEVVKSINDAQIIFVGDFTDERRMKSFQTLVRKLGLEKHVQVTGWTDDPGYYIDQGKLLLSTSFIEGFPNGIAEAQMRGLPVVMYHLDIMMAANNESIFRVGQDDWRGAAEKIIELLTEEDRRRQLGHVAISRASSYSDDRFAANILHLINTHDKLSIYKRYDLAQYRQVIDDLAFYAGKFWPDSEDGKVAHIAKHWFGRRA